MRCFLFFILLLFLANCQTRRKELSPEEFVKWVSSKESGLIKERRVNNVTVRARYLPSHLLAYREYINRERAQPFDTIWQAYKCGVTFQVTLEADKGDGSYGNLLYYDVSTQEQVTARIQYLNFRIQEFIYIQQEDASLEPVLSNFEGFDQLGNKLSFQVSFVLSAKKCGVEALDFSELMLVFDDPYFDLGTNKFSFDTQLIKELPKMIF